MVFLADRRPPVPELDQESISHFLFNTGETAKVHSVLWNGDMVGWDAVGRGGALGVKPEIKLCRLSRNRGGGGGVGFWGTSTFEILQIRFLNSVVSQKCHIVECV